MTAEELINIICPEHFRTSCNDEDLSNAFYVQDDKTMGRSRCSRCSLLKIAKQEEELPIDFDFNKIH